MKSFKMFLLASLCLAVSPCHAYRAVMENIAATNNAIYVQATSNPTYVVTGGSLTVQGNAFSVGTSSFTVSGGNVGIGTSSPGSVLDVNGAATMRSSLAVGTTSIVASGSEILDVKAGTNAHLVVDPNTGKVVVESVNDANAVTVPLEFVGNPTSFYGGNVGIGTIAPATLLHISSGTITIDGNGTAPTVGFALCLTAGHAIGHCTSVTTGTGACTCTSP